VLLAEYIATKTKEFEQLNKDNKFDTTVLANGQRLTNFGVFRKYVEIYLRNNPNVRQDATLVVRHRQPSENGMPLEIDCFSKEKSLVSYEEVQSNIFEHIVSIIPEFDLKVFQRPTGEDFKS